MSKPILAVDVDGVVVLFGRDELDDPPPVQLVLIDGMMRCVSLGAGECLLRLSEHYELVWASGWEAQANRHFPALLGLPELPHLSFDGAARFGSADWKLGPLDAYGRGRPIAWIDDCFDKRCTEWAQERPAPTKLIPIDARRGLQGTHVEALLAWARGLE